MSSVSYKVTDTVNENINQSYSSNLVFAAWFKGWKCQYDQSTTTIGWVTMVFCIDILHGPQKSKRRFMIGAWRTPPLA